MSRKPQKGKVANPDPNAEGCDELRHHVNGPPVGPKGLERGYETPLETIKTRILMDICSQRTF